MFNTTELVMAPACRAVTAVKHILGDRVFGSLSFSTCHTLATYQSPETEAGSTETLDYEIIRARFNVLRDD